MFHINVLLHIKVNFHYKTLPWIRENVLQVIKTSSALHLRYMQVILAEAGCFHYPYCVWVNKHGFSSSGIKGWSKADEAWMTWMIDCSLNWWFELWLFLNDSISWFEVARWYFSATASANFFFYLGWYNFGYLKLHWKRWWSPTLEMIIMLTFASCVFSLLIFPIQI